jgi:hypothetical protein
MDTRRQYLNHLILTLSALAALWLAFNMVAQALGRDQLFVVRDPAYVLGWVILVGYGVVFLFDLLSLLWMSLGRHRSEGVSGGSAHLVILGVLGTLGLMGAKVMVDEIGREERLGWETTGEWVILYVLLTIQLAFCVAVFLRSQRIR